MQIENLNNTGEAGMHIEFLQKKYCAERSENWRVKRRETVWKLSHKMCSAHSEKVVKYMKTKIASSSCLAYRLQIYR